MSGAPIIHRKRNANMGGDPRESERLRDPFLAYIGRRANTTVLRELDIPVGHGTRWLAGVGVLQDIYQQRVRVALDKAGVQGSPCS